MVSLVSPHKYMGSIVSPFETRVLCVCVFFWGGGGGFKIAGHEL